MRTHPAEALGLEEVSRQVEGLIGSESRGLEGLYSLDLESGGGGNIYGANFRD